MTDEELKQEIRDDMLREDYAEQQQDKALYSNLEECLGVHGLYDIHSDIEDLVKKVNRYGHEISIAHVIEALGEL